MKIKAEELIRKIQKGELKSETKIICHMECPEVNFDVETWFMGNWFSTSKKGYESDNDMIVRLCDGRYTYEIIEKDKNIEYELIEELCCNAYDFEKQAINSLIKNQRKLIDEINNLKEKKDE